MGRASWASEGGFSITSKPQSGTEVSVRILSAESRWSGQVDDGLKACNYGS
jgi:hypothetical protein